MLWQAGACRTVAWLYAPLRFQYGALCCETQPFLRTFPYPAKLFNSWLTSARLIGLHHDPPSSLNSELLICGIALWESIPQGKEVTFWFKQRMHCLMNRSSIREPIDDPNETRAQVGISSNEPMQVLVRFSVENFLSHQWDIKILAHIITSCTISSYIPAW